jgi:Zn finger protein HypA/HybF involved in hydrogenase expression
MKQIILSIDPEIWNKYKGLRNAFMYIAIEIAKLNVSISQLSGDSDSVNKAIEYIIKEGTHGNSKLNIEWEEKETVCKVGRDSHTEDKYIVFFIIRKILIV